MDLTSYEQLSQTFSANRYNFLLALYSLAEQTLADNFEPTRFQEKFKAELIIDSKRLSVNQLEYQLGHLMVSSDYPDIIFPDKVLTLAQAEQSTIQNLIGRTLLGRERQASNSVKLKYLTIIQELLCLTKLN